MKKKRVGLVVLTFLLSVIVPDFAPLAAGSTVTKSYTATMDTMELQGHIQYDGIHDNDGDGFLSIGRSNDEFGNVRQRAGITFDLGVPEGNIVSAELVLTVATVIRNPNHTLYMEARGSAANDLNYVTFPSLDTNSPYADKFTAKSIAEVPMGPYLQDQPLTFNVKSAVDAFTDISDHKITFMLNGNETDADSGWFSIHSLETYENAAFRPKLVVTYETGSTNTPPTGSFTILEGAMTSTSTVNLSVTGSDPDIGDSVTHMRFANSAANLSAASWLPFSNTATFSLTGGDGAKTIYMQLRDSNNGISANSSQSILLDQTAPTGTLIINDGATWTKSDTVTLKGIYTDGSGSGVEQARLSNIIGSWQTSWFNIADLNGKSWVLPAGGGAKTVYVQFKDKVGNTSTGTISSMITVDTTAPVITNVEHGKVYNNKVNAVFNEGNGLLNGSPYTSGTDITQDGTYTLIVTDAAGNSSTVTFKIDTTAPIVTGVMNGGIYKSDVTVTFNEGTATLNGTAFISGTQVTMDGVYTLVVTDSAGNVTTVNFAIDKTAPIVTGVTNGGTYKDKVTVGFNEGTATLNGAAFASGTEIDQDGNYTLVVTDTAGHVTTVNFTIDTVAPIVTGVTNGGIYKDKVTVVFNKGTATLNGVTFTSGTEVDQEGTFTFALTDPAGHVTTINFTIDKTAPTVTGVTNGGIYKDKVTVGFNEGTATLNGVNFASGTEINQDGSYALIVTDVAGNVTTVNFTIDSTAPTVTGVTNGGAYKDKVTIVFNKGTATLNGAAFTSGTKVDKEGTYTLVVTNTAGRVTTINFTIDKTAPTVTGVTNGGIYKDKVTVGFNEGTATLNGVNFASGTEINQDGSYALIVTDVAGNVTTVNFTIDSTAPTVTGVTNGGAYKDKVTIVFNKGTATLNGAAFTSGTKVDKEGTYTLVVTNTAGRVTTIKFNIDRTAPSGTIVINGGSATTNSNSVILSLTSSDGSGSGVAEMRFSTDELNWSAWEKVSRSKKWSFTEEAGQKKLYVQFRDAAGNSSMTSMATIDYRPSGGSDNGSSNNGNGSSSSNSNNSNSNSGNPNSNAGNESPPTHIVTTTGKITVPVGSSGETSEGKDIHVSIPVGVAQQELTITVQKLSDITNLLSNGQRLISPIFEVIKNSAGNIKKPLTLTMKFDSSKVGKDQYAAIFSYDPLDKQWLEMKGTTKGDFITVATDEFTKFAIFIVDKSLPISLSDINGHWAQDMIEDIAARGIITGYPDGSFRPDEPIQRQHVAVMVARGFQLTEKRDAVAFSDVPTSHPYDEAITLLQQAGIVDGSNGAFYPNANMTRAQLAKILVLAFGITPSGTSAFQDVPVTHWSHDYIAALAENGIALGDNGYFRPDEPVTRAQFVAFIYRALHL
ncbi:S-layer homology domain-containing protein [Lysinibacillus fusiformis]